MITTEKIILEIFDKGQKVKIREQDISDLTGKELNILFHSLAANELTWKYKRIKIPGKKAANG